MFRQDFNYSFKATFIMQSCMYVPLKRYMKLIQIELQATFLRSNDFTE